MKWSKLFVAVLVMVVLAGGASAQAVSGNPGTDAKKTFIEPFDINTLPRHSQPISPDGCDIALIILRDIGTRSFHYEPGTIDCWFSPNQHGCDVAGVIYEAIRAEFGDEEGGRPYSTGDVARIRKRQAEIATQGTYSFLDIEDWGSWYAGGRIMTFPFLLPPCPPNYAQKQMRISPFLPSGKN